MYRDYWRRKVKNNKSIEFPRKLSPAIAEITASFSFAYLKEAFVAALVVIAGNGDQELNRREADDKYNGGEDWGDNGYGGDGGGEDLNDLTLWVEMKKRVKLLREDMGDPKD